MHRIFNFFYFDAQRIPWVPEGFLFVAKLRSQSQLGYEKKKPSSTQGTQRTHSPAKGKYSSSRSLQLTRDETARFSRKAK